MEANPIGSCSPSTLAGNAYLILGGDKTGDANWYVDAIRRAEVIYALHLIEIGE